MYSEITVHNYCLSIPATANGMIRATQKFPAIRYVVISTLSALTKTTICMNSALLTTSSLTVSLVYDQDSQLKQLYYQLSILGFLYWITKMQSVQFSLISLKHLTQSHTRNFFSNFNIQCLVQHQSYFIVDYLSSSYPQLQKKQINDCLL